MSRSEILVGFDSSPAGRAALSWAADHARRTGTPLRAVHVESWPEGVAVDSLAAHEVREVSVDQLEAAHLHSVSRLFDEIRPQRDWLLQVVSGEPGPALVGQSTDAALLVLGAPSHHGLNRLLAGSVAHYCFNHATCPVAIVPADAAPSGFSGESAHEAST